MIFERVGRGMATFVVRWRWLTVLVGLLAGAAFASGIRYARFSTDYRIFFSRDDARLTEFVKLENRFAQTDNVLFVVHARTGTVFTADALAAVQELEGASWQLPYAARVDSLSNFQRARADLEVGQ